MHLTMGAACMTSLRYGLGSRLTAQSNPGVFSFVGRCDLSLLTERVQDARAPPVRLPVLLKGACAGGFKP